MSREDVLAYIRGGGTHFLSLADVPVVADSATISAALLAARDWGTRAVVVRGGNNEFGLTTIDDLAAHQQKYGATSESVDAPIANVVQAEISVADMVESIDRVREDFGSVGVKIVLESGRAVGLLSEAEDWESRFFRAPKVYTCSLGHAWAPPPPAECFCGRPVG